MCRTQEKSFRWSLHTVCFGREWCFGNSTVNEESFSSCYHVHEYAGITPVKWNSSCVYNNLRNPCITFFHRHTVNYFNFSLIFFSKHHQKNMSELICSDVYLHFFLIFEITMFSLGGEHYSTQFFFFSKGQQHTQIDIYRDIYI